MNIQTALKIVIVLYSVYNLLSLGIELNLKETIRSTYTKNIVAAGLAEECLVQLGYCIGLVDPVSVMVNTYGTGKLPDEALAKLVRQVFPLSPHGIIDHLKLRLPV
jgi:S-adenosylmethionine synthetase